jgi:hypothetical protein
MNEKTFDPNTINIKKLKKVMIEEELLNMASIGEYCGFSRERIRQIMKERGIEFKSLKAEVTLAIYQTDITLKDEEWKLIVSQDTAHGYYISNLGRVSRKLTKTKNGTTYTFKKLLNPSPDAKGRLRVNLTLNSLDDEGEIISKPCTKYVHTLVCETFNGMPNPETQKPRVEFEDKDYGNCNKDNVSWEKKPLETA